MTKITLTLEEQGIKREIIEEKELFTRGDMLDLFERWLIMLEYSFDGELNFVENE